MVDGAPNNIVLLTPQGDVEYINPAAQSLLDRYDTHFALAASALKGLPICQVFDLPHDVRSALNVPERLPMTTVVDFACEKIEVEVVPIRSEDNHYLGPMLSFAVVS